MRVRVRAALSPIVWRSYSKVDPVNTCVRHDVSQGPKDCATFNFLESAKAGEGLFRDVLRCKTRADKTRSALTVLQRYRFLFNLPHTIEKNITNVSTGH